VVCCRIVGADFEDGGRIADGAQDDHRELLLGNAARGVDRGVEGREEEVVLVERVLLEAHGGQDRGVLDLGPCVCGDHLGVLYVLLPLVELQHEVAIIRMGLPQGVSQSLVQDIVQQDSRRLLVALVTLALLLSRQGTWGGIGASSPLVIIQDYFI
jgi:hypothetical protein